MTSLREIRKLWAAHRCIGQSSEPKSQLVFWDKKRGVTPTVCLDGWAALESTLRATGYPVPGSVGFVRPCSQGIDKKKPCESSGENCSAHNYGIAVDIDPPLNPHFHSAFVKETWDFSNIEVTRLQVEAVERIKTKKGVRVFRWLGWSEGDTMHFEFNCAPKSLKAGIDPTTVLIPDGAPPFVGEEEEMAFTPDEEAFLKNFVKVVVEDMGSSRAFAKSAITDIRKDIITRNELIKFFSGLPTGSADEAIKELLRRLNQ